MRIDKFLKNSRIIKRRTVAKDACDGGRIFINERLAKAGTSVNVGDKVRIEFGNSIINFEVLDITDSQKKEDADKMYRIID